MSVWMSEKGRARVAAGRDVCRDGQVKTPEPSTAARIQRFYRHSGLNLCGAKSLLIWVFLSFSLLYTEITEILSKVFRVPGFVERESATWPSLSTTSRVEASGRKTFVMSVELTRRVVEQAGLEPATDGRRDAAIRPPCPALHR